MRSNGVDRETELALLDGVRAGDEAAFDAIYAAYNGRLLGFLARLSGSRDVAEELLDEIWLRFVRHADRLQPGTYLGPWLFTVARNLHVSYCRTRAFELGAGASLSLWPDPSRETPFELLARSEFENRVEAALAALPGILREALLLIAVEGMTPSEAATVCGVTAEAMRQRLRRGRAMLADDLGITKITKTTEGHEEVPMSRVVQGPREVRARC
jgi:RNA polymerase sigma factor (sigma-70 family)